MQIEFFGVNIVKTNLVKIPLIVLMKIKVFDVNIVKILARL